jgi:hypothetical protein
MMKGIKLKSILLVTMAIIVVSGSIGAAYACFETPSYGFYSPGKVELKICDEDQGWGDDVVGTWTASNMAPGDEFTFNGQFVGLKSQFTPRMNIGELEITCNYNAWTARQPDKMAKYMEITRCVYYYTDKMDKWQINCLTGKLTRVSKQGNIFFPANRNWQIQDVDRDGRITFYDLKKRPLENIPSFSNDETRFEMSVRFCEDAGNEFQNDIFNLTMVYTLTGW